MVNHQLHCLRAPLVETLAHPLRLRLVKSFENFILSFVHLHASKRG